MSEIDLNQQDVARLHELEQISVVKRRPKLVDESDVKAAESVVPPCRLANIEKTKNQIDIELARGFQLGCCSK